MSKIRKINPLLLVVAALVMTALAAVGGYNRLAHAQQGIPDQTSGFTGTVTNSVATCISTTTLSGSGSSTPVVSPPGTTAQNARIHLKSIEGIGATSCTFQFLEHPTSGSDKFICNLNVGAASPNSIRAGNNQGLGLQGYMTAPGSSVRVICVGVASSVAGFNFTYSLE